MLQNALSVRAGASVTLSIRGSQQLGSWNAATKERLAEFFFAKMWGFSGFLGSLGTVFFFFFSRNLGRTAEGPSSWSHFAGSICQKRSFSRKLLVK